MRREQADGHVPQPADVEQEGRLVVGKVLPEKIVVNEVELCATSPLRQLRAACNFFGVSRSKCFERLVSPYEGERAESGSRGRSSSPDGRISAAKSTTFDHGANAA